MQQAEATGMKITSAYRMSRMGYAIAHGWLELLAASPILLVVAGILTDGGASGWIWLSSMTGYTVLSALVASVPWLRWTGVLLLVNAAVCLWWGYAVNGLGASVLFSWAAGFVLAFRSTQLIRFGAAVRMPYLSLWMGLAACAPAAFIIHRSKELAGYSDGLAYISSALFLAAILLSNRSSLEGASYRSKINPSSPAARRMKLVNRLLLLFFGVPVLAVSFWGIIDRAVSRAAEALLRAFLSLFAGGKEPEKPLLSNQPPAEAQMPPMAGEEKPFWLWELLERIVMLAAAAAAVVVALLLLRQLYRRLPGWVRVLLNWLARYRKSTEEEDPGYVDEVLSTKDNRTVEPGGGPWRRFSRLFKRSASVRWEDLKNGQERIRYLYGRALRRAVRGGWVWKPQWTPSETASQAAAAPAASRLLEPELCEAYEQARYGGIEPDEELVRRLKERIEDSRE